MLEKVNEKVETVEKERLPPPRIPPPRAAQESRQAKSSELLIAGKTAHRRENSTMADEPAVTSRSLEERERELVATIVAPTVTVASEYDRHTETLERGEAEAEDPWAFAGDNESIDSFIAGAAPSCTAKAWIATQHDERKRLVEEYYEKLEGVEGAAGRESMGEISAAWEAAEAKTLDALTGVLKEHKYGCGKWMVRRHGQRALVVPQLATQAAWDAGHRLRVWAAPLTAEERSRSSGPSGYAARASARAHAAHVAP
jgi:hypothetical protein